MVIRKPVQKRVEKVENVEKRVKFDRSVEDTEKLKSAMKVGRKKAQLGTIKVLDDDDGVCRLNCNCPLCMKARAAGRKPVHQSCQEEFCVHGPNIKKLEVLK